MFFMFVIGIMKMLEIMTIVWQKIDKGKGH